MAAGKPPHGQPESSYRTVGAQRFKRVLAAGGSEPAYRGKERADEAAVAEHGNDKEPCRQCRHGVCRANLRCAHYWRAPTCRRSSRPRTRSRSAASSAWRTPAAAGWARSTRRQPPGSEATRLRISSRSCRFTRLRTTAEPTARLTTKPTFGAVSICTGPFCPGPAACPTPEGCPAPEGGSSRCPVTTGPPARRPERRVRLNSSGLLIRDCCGSTGAAGLANEPRQTASFSRPLRRRAARTARPARVLIRSRKPWTLCRRRLFGWNVRLLTFELQYGSGSW
jgi:hypothetical protein